MVADPWRQLKGDTRVPKGLALFCKEEGSGVAVSVNNVGCKGSGVPRPMGDKIIVEGLVPNESYVFATAAIDERGRVIEGIGETSVPIVALLPLPTLLIWGHLCLAAHQMALPALARAAAQPLYSRLVHEGPERPFWERSPLSKDFLRADAVERAPAPLLRVLVLVLAVLADAADGPEPAGGALAARAPTAQGTAVRGQEAGDGHVRGVRH